ncbi:MAG: MFS transporter [Actinomycetota bacterium]|nr:MFS transporter [Actinomycetota bacterium]
MLSNPSIRRVVVARLVSRIGGEAAFFVGLWGKAAFELDATPAQLATVMAALGVASLIGASMAGVLVDRFDPRRVLIYAEILFIPVALALIFADSIPTLAIAAFALGLVGMPVYTAIASFAPYLTEDEDELSKINGLIEGASWIAFIIGPALGAVLVATVSIDSIFVLDAATSAIGAILILPVKVRQLSKDTGESGGFKELKEGFSYSYSHHRLRFYIWIGSSVWLLFGTFGALEPLFFRDVLGTELETLGWVNSIFGVGLVAGTLIAGRLGAGFRTARVVTILVAMNAVGVLAYVGTDNLAVVVPSGAFWGLIIGMMAPLLRTMIQVNSPDEMVGRIMSVSHIHSEVGHLMPLAIAPWLAASFGVQQTLLGAGIGVAVVAMLFWPKARQLDRTRIVDVPATGLADPSEEPRSVGH